MKRFQIFLISRFFLTFVTHLVVGEQYPYELNIIEHATEIRNSDSDSLATEVKSFGSDLRLSWCRNGFNLIKRSGEGEHINFLESTPVQDWKTYVFVESGKGGGGENVAVVLGYECPTSPAIYIHADLQNGTSEEVDEPAHGRWSEDAIIWVLFKDSPSNFPLRNILNYQFKIVDEIIEADSHQMRQMSKKSILAAVVDTEDLPEEERFKMCKRVIQTVPDLSIELRHGSTTGKSKYYIATAKMDRRGEASRNLRLAVQAFDCPSVPRIYVNVNVRDDPKDGYILWAMTEANKTAQPRPVLFNIMGYNVALVKSMTVATSEYILVVVHAYNRNNNVLSKGPIVYLAVDDISSKIEKDQSTDSNIVEGGVKWLEESAIHRRFKIYSTRVDPSQRTKSSEYIERGEVGVADSSLTASDDVSTLNPCTKLTMRKDKSKGANGKRVTFADTTTASESELANSELFINSQFGTYTSASKRDQMFYHGAFDPDDDFTTEERMEMCRKAVKAVSVQEVEFTGFPAGPSQYYVVERERNKEIGDIVRAFDCPTEPKIFLHYSDRESVEKMIWVIVVGRENFEYLTAKFRK